MLEAVESREFPLVKFINSFYFLLICTLTATTTSSSSPNLCLLATRLFDFHNKTKSIDAIFFLGKDLGFVPRW